MFKGGINLLVNEGLAGRQIRINRGKLLFTSPSTGCKIVMAPFITTVLYEKVLYEEVENALRLKIPVYFHLTEDGEGDAITGVSKEKVTKELLETMILTDCGVEILFDGKRLGYTLDDFYFTDIRTVEGDWSRPSSLPQAQ